jgi:hypothetical protein
MRLLLVDDHEVVRRGVRSLLSDDTGWDVCGEAVDGQDGVLATNKPNTMANLSRECSGRLRKSHLRPLQFIGTVVQSRCF